MVLQPVIDEILTILQAKVECLPWFGKLATTLLIKSRVISCRVFSVLRDLSAEQAAAAHEVLG